MAHIAVDSTGKIVVSGELNFATVPELNNLGGNLLKNSARSVFDFAGVVACDNAAVALLVAWARLAKQQDREIVFTNLPQQLHDLVVACGLANILPMINN